MPSKKSVTEERRLSSRREFLERSMFAAAAVAAAGSAAPAPARSAHRKAGPNDVLRVAVIGVNGRGNDHLSGFVSREGTEVTVICDADTAAGERACDRVEKSSGKRPAFVQDLRRVFDDTNVDVVTIATPNHWHALAAIWAMQAGKDVYVEKPVSHNVSEGRRAVEAARKYGKICQTGTQCRSMIGTIDAIAYVHAGKIGEVKRARGLCYKRRPAIGARGEYKVPETVDYDLWCGPAATLPLTRPKFHYDWHWQWEYGNGDLGNQGIHQMDIARWGLQAAGVGDSVYSFGGRVGYVDAGETANTQVSVHTFGDKTLVFEVRGLPTEQYKGAGVGVVFHGTEGYVVLTSYDAGAAFDPKGNMITAFKGGGDHYGNFVDAVRARDPGLLRADIEEGHLSSALCHLGNISYRVGETVPLGELRERLSGMPSREAGLEALERMTAHLAANQLDASTRVACGKALTIDPAKETFTGRGADFNAMLTRPGRAPFLVPAAGQV